MDSCVRVLGVIMFFRKDPPQTEGRRDADPLIKFWSGCEPTLSQPELVLGGVMVQSGAKNFGKPTAPSSRLCRIARLGELWTCSAHPTTTLHKDYTL